MTFELLRNANDLAATMQLIKMEPFFAICCKREAGARLVADSSGSSEMVIMKPSELKAMNIYIHSADIRQGCYCYEQYKFSIETNSRLQPTPSHDRHAASAAQRGHRVDKMHISPPSD